MNTSRRDVFSARSTSVIFACAIGNFVSVTPIINLTFSNFLIPVSQDLGWQRSQFSFVLTLLSVIGIIVYPLSGRLMDRIGARPVALVGSVAFGLSVASLSLLAPNSALVYGLFALVGVAATLPSSVLMSRVVSTWFFAQRGLVLGLSGGVAFGIGGMVMPVVAQSMIDGFGWRSAYLGLGAIIIALGFPTFALLLRDAPGFAKGSDGEEPALSGLTRSQALRTPAFWLLAVSVMLGAGSVAAIVTHIVPIVQESGQGVTVALSALAALSLSNAVWQMVLGMVLDRVSTPRIAGIFVLLGIIGVLMLCFAREPAWILLGGLLIGFSSGTEYGLLPFCIPRYFGFRAYGEIYGCIFGAIMVGQGLAPFLADVAFEATGSYRPAMFGIAGLLLVCGITIACLPRYRIGSLPDGAATPGRFEIAPAE